MNSVIAWLVRNPVAANLMMVFIVVAGLLAAGGVRDELYPEVSSDRIGVEVFYPGAAAREVELAVVLRVEEAIQGIDGIRTIRSTASEEYASVAVELAFGADLGRVLDEVQNNLDAITTFPADVEEPIVRELAVRTAVTYVAVVGHVDVGVLKTLAERIRDELAALPEISQVDIVNAPPYEISIEVSENTLRRHGLTFDEVANAVRGSSLDVPGGSVRGDGGEILLRTFVQAYRGAEYENLLLWARPDGSRLQLGDVATVVDGFAETDQHARFDSAPAIMLAVFRTGDQSAIDIVGAVARHVERLAPRMPEGVSMTLWQNQAARMNDRLGLMLRNGAAAFVLVFGVLLLFLELRLAFWVSVGIPISLLGTIALMPTVDVSFNQISLFAFILVLGIVVDDAIIVGENVFRHQEFRGDGRRGAIDGAQEIAAPVVFAVLTTVASFLPLLFVPGSVGKLFQAIPLVAVPCLVFSLIESLGILPAHLAGHARRGAPGGRPGRPRIAARGLALLSRRVYQPLLDAAVRWRYLTAAIGIAALMLTAGTVIGGRIAFRFLPAVEADTMTASVTMPQGTPSGLTSRAVEEIERAAYRLGARLERDTGIDYVRHVSTAVGDQPTRALAGGPLGPVSTATTPNIGEVTVELAPAETRTLTSVQLGNLWREETGPIPEAVELTFDLSLVDPGADIDVQLAGRDPDLLRSAAAAVRRRLVEYAGVYGITDSFRAGQEEMRLAIKPAAETFGLTQEALGRQVRQAFHGEEAQRIQRGRDDIRVMVRYPRAERRSLANLENMRVRTPDGAAVPFVQVAQVEPGRAPTSITRVNRHRAVNVTASVDPAVTSAGAVLTDLNARVLPEVLADHPGVVHSLEGAQAEQATALRGLRIGFALALLAIYALLAVPLRSYAQPLLIMGAIPFGVVGAVWGHGVMGLDFTIMSMFGVVALTGVVVNDSLILVDVINRRRRAGADIDAATRAAGASRFRPIVLTSVTTFAGLAPLMLERSSQAAFLVPMAVSLAFGVLFATFITLLLVPVWYLILDDTRRATRALV